MTKNLVGVSVSLTPDLLTKINKNIEGNSQSARIRKCVTKGYKILNGETNKK